MLTLPVEKRESAGTKAPVLRRAGKLPAVVYGPHQESTAISIDARAFDKVLRDAGESSIVMLSGLGMGELPTLIHEVDLDPLTNRPRHIDFYAVTKGEKVEVSVELEFTGESPAVKAGMNIVKVLHEIEVKADPMNLPKSVTVDVSSLAAVGDQIHVRDLVLPSDVELVTEPEDVVALVQEVVIEKAEEAPVDISTIEVEEKGKEKVKGEETAPAETEKEKK